jgi:phage regulator Rha-like protein
LKFSDLGITQLLMSRNGHRIREIKVAGVEQFREL